MSGGVSAATIFAGLGAAAAVYTASQSGKTRALAGAPTAPAAAPPTVMPIPDDEAVKNAQRKQMLATQARRGRDSTILSDPASGDLLGG